MFNGKKSIIFMVILSIVLVSGGFFIGSRSGRGDIGNLRDTNRELQRSLEQSKITVKLLKKLKLNLMQAEKSLETSKTLLKDSEAHSTNLELQLQEVLTTSTALTDQLNSSSIILKEQESSINKLQNELVIWGVIGIVIGATVGILLE